MHFWEDDLIGATPIPSRDSSTILIFMGLRMQSRVKFGFFFLVQRSQDRFRLSMETKKVSSFRVIKGMTYYRR